jgi:NADPH-dependent 2,4-dienoyl-CoA reductase/sulfur reductase-like enzyme
MDYVSVGTGGYFDFYKIIPTVMYEDKLGAPFAEALRPALKTAVLQVESLIRTPENADAVIGAGQADLVSIVRGQIADPHMAAKAVEGRAEDVRPCLSCNQMCWGRRYRDYWISCVVNPSAGREFEWGGDRFTPAEAPREVLVVGGGPAGMEAARVAAERGHRVTLAEASDRLGGRFRLAGLQPRRAQILDLIGWYETQLSRLRVKVNYNSPMDPDEVRAFGAGAVVLATGAQPAGTGFQKALPQFESLPGIDAGNVFSVDEVMARSARPGEHAVVLDDIGHWDGLGTALYLAEAGHRVTVVTWLPVIGAELTRSSNDGPIRRRFKQLGVQTFTETALKEWRGAGATLVDLRDGEEIVVAADSLVLATIPVAEDWLARELQDSGLEIHSIGDSVHPRRVHMAIHEGRKVGLTL